MTGRTCRLLVVEDNAEDRAAWHRALAGGADGAFEIVDAETGEEGLERCRQERWDCVLLDHQLPDMDALEFLGALSRGTSELPSPVIVLTGQGNEAVAVRALRAGAVDYLVKGAAPADLERAIRGAIATSARRGGRTFRVLVVDDSPEDREAYRRRLQDGEDGFEFAEADTGEEGLALAAAFRPDCILLDHGLPDLDGLEVLAELVRRHGAEMPAVLLLTGHGSEALAVRALKSGAEDYLVKGQALDALPRTIRAAVEKVELRQRLERQQAEVARSRNHLHVTLSSIGDGVVSTDRQGRVTFLNPVAEWLTGWSSAEAAGRPLEEILVLLDEESRKPLENPARRALRDDVITTLPPRSLLVARDGIEHPIDDSAAPIRDTDGSISGAVLVFRDVGQRRRTEATLTLHSRVLESMGEGVSVADDRGYITWTNPAEDRMFGYERGELIGRHVSEQNDYPPDENARRVAETMAALQRDGTWAGEWRNRRKDGTPFVSYARITRLVSGNATWLVCVQEDVTDRKRLEEELRSRVEQLALADRRKDEFLAMLAHELRNPLAPISNALHLLKLRGEDPGVVERSREMMERQVTHLVRLVDDLLDVARITEGKVILRRERLDLARLVRHSTADHRTRFDAAGLALDVKVRDEPIWVSGDPTRLTQVIDNFLTNAAKFTNPGGRVTVVLEEEGTHAHLSVTDTGIGLAPDILPHVFDVFAQADRSLDRSRGGLGLGLAIVKGLVELHGGTVRAESAGLGSGTTMRLCLPLAPGAAPAVEDAAAPAAATARRRVLVVEDNVDAAESLGMILEVSGIDVRIAHAGDEGVRVATEWVPDVVVCDIGLPVMDGFAVARALRADPRAAGIRLVALTGYGRAEDLQAAKAAGFDAHLVKPVDFDELLQKVQGG